MKIDEHDAGHMTKMAATPIYIKQEDQWSCKRSPDILA